MNKPGVSLKFSGNSLLHRSFVTSLSDLSFFNGYKLIIENFEVTSGEMTEEVVLEETLEFLDKKFYEEIFKDKGMMNNVGQKIRNHPGFALTPVRMTRSKARQQENPPPMKKMKTGGFKCYKCDKPCKTEKGFNNHKCGNL